MTNTATTYNEQELLQQIAEGDVQAFAVIFEKYRQPLYTYLLRITKSEVIAEDIVADVFMKLWIGRELAPEIKNTEAFLRKVAYNKAMDFFNIVSRHTKLQEEYKRWTAAQTGRVPDEILIDEEARKILLEAVNQLPPQRKLIYTLSRHEGLTHDEISKLLNLSQHTIKNSITSANRSIIKFLRKTYDAKTALMIFFFIV